MQGAAAAALGLGLLAGAPVAGAAVTPAVYFAPTYAKPSLSVLSVAPWTAEQEPAGLTDRLQIVTGDQVPGPIGGRPAGALKARIAPGDVTIGGGEHKRRSELVWTGRQFGAGEEVWLSFPFYVPVETALTGAPSPWTDIFQWHGTDRNPPPVYLGLTAKGQFIIDSGLPGQPDIVLGSVAPGTWQRVTLGVSFSTTGSGWLEGQIGDAAPVRRARQTISPGQKVYAKEGLYESWTWGETYDRTVFHGPIRIGTSRALVTAPAPTPTPAPARS